MHGNKRGQNFVDDDHNMVDFCKSIKLTKKQHGYIKCLGLILRHISNILTCTFVSICVYITCYTPIDTTDMLLKSIKCLHIKHFMCNVVFFWILEIYKRVRCFIVSGRVFTLPVLSLCLFTFSSFPLMGIENLHDDVRNFQ